MSHTEWNLQKLQYQYRFRCSGRARLKAVIASLFLIPSFALLLYPRTATVKARSFSSLLPPTDWSPRIFLRIRPPFHSIPGCKRNRRDSGGRYFLRNNASLCRSSKTFKQLCWVQGINTGRNHGKSSRQILAMAATTLAVVTFKDQALLQDYDVNRQWHSVFGSRNDRWRNAFWWHTNHQTYHRFRYDIPQKLLLAESRVLKSSDSSAYGWGVLTHTQTALTWQVTTGVTDKLQRLTWREDSLRTMSREDFPRDNSTLVVISAISPHENIKSTRHRYFQA